MPVNVSVVGPAPNVAVGCAIVVSTVVGCVMQLKSRTLGGEVDVPPVIVDANPGSGVIVVLPWFEPVTLVMFVRTTNELPLPKVATGTEANGLQVGLPVLERKILRGAEVVDTFPKSTVSVPPPPSMNATPWAPKYVESMWNVSLSRVPVTCWMFDRCVTAAPVAYPPEDVPTWRSTFTPPKPNCSLVGL